MARPYAKLRGLMAEQGITHSDLGKALYMDQSSVTARMNDRIPWKLPEVYTVLETLSQPPERMHELFPRDGINEPGVSRGKRGGQSA